MRNYTNIEPSIRSGEYVGYANGAWRIRKNGCGGWEAVPIASSFNTGVPADYIRAKTLDEMSGKLATKARELPNPFVS